jgi:EpsD family peptidyl-prolyl cis-trans isomerase
MSCTKQEKAMAQLAMATCVALALCGCGKSGTAVPTQLAARMGSDEVTLYEVDRAAARLPAKAPTDMAGTRKSVLDELIDQHLMADEAVKHKLDRSPDTVSNMESCRLSTLENAYLTSIAEQPSGSEQSRKADVQNYYEHHPALFSDRKIYWIKEIAIPQNAGIDVAEAEQLSPSDLLALLEQRGINYRSMFGRVPADALPPELLDTMVSLKDGRSTVLNIYGNVLVLTRVSSSAAPVDLQTAEPAILRYLRHQELDARVHAQVASLRSQAGVRYLNEFTIAPVASDAAQRGASATAVATVKR